MASRRAAKYEARADSCSSKLCAESIVSTQRAACAYRSSIRLSVRHRVYASPRCPLGGGLRRPWRPRRPTGDSQIGKREWTRTGYRFTLYVRYRTDRVLRRRAIPRCG
jgi:hypothetical protein